MNSYDARAGLKLGFTAAGTAIGGPIGGAIGSAVGTLSGALIPTKTFIKEKTSFNENVDQNMSYSRADYGKGFLNYTSQEREKATSFSKIADTAADAIPMVAGAAGFKGLSKFKFPSLGGKTDALTEADKVISTGNEVTAEIGTAVKNNTMKKVFDYGTKSIGTINDMVDLFGNKNATEVDNNSENKLGLSNKLFMRDNNFKSTPIETDFNSIDFDKSMNKVMGLKGESVFRSIDSYKEFPTSEFGVEQRIDPITNNLQRKEFSFPEPKLIESNTPALDISNMPERNNRQSEIKNSEESNYLAKKFSGESSTNQSFFRSLDPFTDINGKSISEIEGFEPKPSEIIAKPSFPLLTQRYNGVEKKNVVSDPYLKEKGININTETSLPDDVATFKSSYESLGENETAAILSKKTDILYNVNNKGEILASTPALRGKAKGDYVNSADPNVEYYDSENGGRTTPSGIFNVSGITPKKKGYTRDFIDFSNNYKKDKFGGFEYTGTQAIHTTYNNEPKRLSAYNNEPGKRCFSWGCINIPEKAYDIIDWEKVKKVVVTPEPNEADKKINFNKGNAFDDSDVNSEMNRAIDAGIKTSFNYASNPEFKNRLLKLGKTEQEANFIISDLLQTKFDKRELVGTNGNFPKRTDAVRREMFKKYNGQPYNKSLEPFFNAPIYVDNKVSKSEQTVSRNQKLSTVHEFTHKIDDATQQLKNVDFTKFLDSKGGYRQDKAELAAVVREIRVAINPKNPFKKLTKNDIPKVKQLMKTSNYKEKLKGIKDLGGFLEYSNILAYEKNNKKQFNYA